MTAVKRKNISVAARDASGALLHLLDHDWLALTDEECEAIQRVRELCHEIEVQGLHRRNTR